MCEESWVLGFVFGMVAGLIAIALGVGLAAWNDEKTIKRWNKTKQQEDEHETNSI